MTTATAAGTSHGGRSTGRAPPAGGRGTVGRRAGGTGVGASEGAGAGGRVSVATPDPSGSAGIPWPGFHVGCSTGVHVCSAALLAGAGVTGSGAGGGGAETGGAVEKAGKGATGATGSAGGGEAGRGGSGSIHFGGSG